MENEFTKVMANQSDRQLIAIVTTERKKYQFLAIEAAEKEIKARGLSVEHQETLRQQNFEAMERAFEFEVRNVESSIRFVHLLVDTIIIFILYFLAFVILLLMGMQTDEESFAPILIFLFVYLGYYISMESAWQQTIGKMMTRTKVMTTSNEIPTNGDIVARSFCRLIPFDRLSFLFTRNGFHDAISKTTVVKK